MSYDITLKDSLTLDTIHFDTPHNMKGGTYAVSGTKEAWLNITYNYGKYYREAYPEDGIRAIYGKSGEESISILQKMIDKIKENYPDLKESDDYWEPLPGNAIKPLYKLIEMAKMRPDVVWDGD